MEWLKIDPNAEEFKGTQFGDLISQLNARGVYVYSQEDSEKIGFRGNTYKGRNSLKFYRARWDAENKQWALPDAKNFNLAVLDMLKFI